MSDKVNEASRTFKMIAAVSADDSKLMLIEDNRNPLIRLVIDEFCPRFTPGATVLYARNVGTKFNSVGAATLEQKGIVINKHDRLPDVIIDYRAREWLVVVEATSPCRPISLDRRNELTAMLSSYGQWTGLQYKIPTRNPNQRSTMPQW